MKQRIADATLFFLMTAAVAIGLTYLITVIISIFGCNCQKESQMPKEKPAANAYFVERELIVTFPNGEQIILRRNQFKELRRGLNALNKKLEAEKPLPRFVLEQPGEWNNTKWRIIDTKYANEKLDVEFEPSSQGAIMAARLTRELNKNPERLRA